MEFTFTNNTLTNLTKEAKKLVKNSTFNLSDAKNEIAIKRGFKSYHNIYKAFNAWSALKPVIVCFKQPNIGKFKYKLNKNDDLTWQDLTVDDINHTRNYGLKRLNVKDNVTFLEKYDNNEINRDTDIVILNNIYKNHIFFEFTTYKFDYESEKQKALDSFIENEGSDEFRKSMDEMSGGKNSFHTSLFNESIPVIIEEQLIQKHKVNDKNFHEEIKLYPEYFIVDNKIHHVDKPENEVYDFVF